MSGYSVLLVGAVAAGLSVGGWFATPKGPNQVVIRHSIYLTLACCYIFWAITYLAQLHPLEAPKKSGLRPGYN